MKNFKRNIYRLSEGTTIPPTSYEWYFSSPGRTSSSLACAQTTFPLPLYTEVNALDLGVQMYTSPSLSTQFGSGDLWYQYGIDGIAYRIDNSGVISDIVVCTPIIDCVKWNVFIDPIDLADATGNTNGLDNKVFIQYVDCSVDGYPQEYEASTEGVFTNAFCGIQTTTYSYYYKNDAIQYGGSYAETDDIQCSVGTTCYSYTVTNSMSSAGTIRYLNCLDQYIIETVNGNDTYTICSIGGISASAGITVIADGGIC